MIPPDPIPFRPRRNATCTDCSPPLEPEQKWRCRSCIAAAHAAIRAAGPGRVVRPSDVAAQREDG